MLPGRILAARIADENEIEKFRENERLKRSASLRPAQHAGHIRSNQRFVARSRAASRTRTWHSGHVEHVEIGAQRKSIRRLEPKRRTQNHYLRLFPSRQSRTDCFHASLLGRSRQLPEKEKSRSPEIPLRQNANSRRKNGRPLCVRRKIETEIAQEMETVIHVSDGSFLSPLQLFMAGYFVTLWIRRNFSVFNCRKIRP